MLTLGEFIEREKLTIEETKQILCYYLAMKFHENFNIFYPLFLTSKLFR